MDGHFEKGVFVEGKSLEELRQNAVDAAMAYHRELCKTDEKYYGYSWAETGTGELFVISVQPKYSAAFKKCMEGLK